MSIPPPAFEFPSTTPPARIALLLPLRSGPLLQAAEAVRAGFLAAWEREREGVTVDVIETGDAPQDILATYAEAAAQHDIVVGPLSRSGVTALAQGNAISRPTIALTQPELPTEGELKLPQQLLVIGLSIEDEARQAANWAATDKKVGKAFVIATATAWQRRAAHAFAAQWQQKGKEAEIIELTASSGYLEAKGLSELKGRLQSDQPAVLFVALDARQARQVRAAAGRELPLYGTSQLNPLALSDWETAERTGDLDGARFFDMPWQLQSDHPAVMSYAHAEAGAEQKRSADLERLYALGIDAWRVAQAVAAKNNSFELDGVTGKLTVRFGQGAPSFVRVQQQAVYRQGGVAPVANRR
ncbi:penicillin-binding protein activator [Noviherbaspirillum cavernae]|uniref:penicillin-binding protein activator n=1 Tax=Noviherbaspirillum cavernae TaxID=2320862 RepID=UPI001F5BCA5B|nr:penicillin-binding protein activator [Noviherbaspirillum cavernae]